MVIKAEKPSDITKKLAENKSKIKADKEYNVMVVSDGLKVSSTDKKVTLPAVTDAIINLTFSSKFAEKKDTFIIEDTELDYVNLTFASDTLDLMLKMDASTVTLKSTGSFVVNELYSLLNYYGVYYSSNQTFGNRALTLGEGVTVKAIDPMRGLVIVGEDAAVEALIVYNTDEDNWDENYVYGNNDGIYHYRSSTLDYQGNREYRHVYQNIRTADNKVNFLHSVKVKKGKGEEGEYTRINSTSSETPIEKVTIEDGAVVYVGDTNENIEEHTILHSYINEIVGLGKGTAVVSPANRNAFRDVQKISNVTVNNSYCGRSEIIIHTNLESCTVESFKYVTFSTETQAVKKTEFKVAEQVYFNIDATNGATAYKFDYSECVFPEDCKIGVNDITTDHPILDADGNVLEYWVYHYGKYAWDEDAKTWKKDDDGNYVKVVDEWGNQEWGQTKDFDEIPYPARLEGNVTYHLAQGREQDDYINDTTITIGLTGSKVGTTKITKDYDGLNVYAPRYWESIWADRNNNAQFTYKYDIDGKLYRLVYDQNWGKNTFVTTN